MRPSEKKVLTRSSFHTSDKLSNDQKVEFTINKNLVEFSMKLGEGGEAFFIFQTDSEVPIEMQISPIASPSDSPANYPPNVSMLCC